MIQKKSIWIETENQNIGLIRSHFKTNVLFIENNEFVLFTNNNNK